MTAPAATPAATGRAARASRRGLISVDVRASEARGAHADERHEPAGGDGERPQDVRVALGDGVELRCRRSRDMSSTTAAPSA